MRKILEQRLENAKWSYSYDKNEEVYGSILAYQDVLTLLPPDRTVKEILKDFEESGWLISRNDELKLTLRCKEDTNGAIWIDKIAKDYTTNCRLSMKDHKLLNELFSVLRWI